METTVLSVKSILSAAFDCAVATTKSVLDEQGIVYDNAEIEAKIRSKMNLILDDSGVQANLLGKAATIDQALNGKMASANRNANWMTTQYTVAKLDEDVNRLRMMLSAKNIDQKMRVLNSCFKVQRNPNKSSSVITCTKLLKEKLKRGEVIEVEDQEDVKMEVDTKEEVDWKGKFERARAKFQEKYNSWILKAKKVAESVKNMQSIIANQQVMINSYEEKLMQKDMEYKNRIESLISSLEWKLNSRYFEDDIKQDYLQELETFTVIDVNDGVANIEEFIHRLLDDFSDSVSLLKGLTTRFGLTTTFE
uniref:Non-structural protein 3 n=1 Tax=Rotavirus A RVA/Raccoon-tc/JPN/Rac-311/2011/G34P[17] TaxID=1935387 RepID=A0A2Z6FBH2_9REOV|nr:non-structural protein NSP3 [Rotavirus A RVA/Raccoon-tc/JPN/Rac-311/2011/G34P[17]]